MGLLDDAIREHLELKRRRGADPDEVARAEQDALGPPGRPTPLEDTAAAQVSEVDPNGAEAGESTAPFDAFADEYEPDEVPAGERLEEEPTRVFDRGLDAEPLDAEPLEEEDDELYDEEDGPLVEEDYETPLPAQEEDEEDELAPAADAPTRIAAVPPPPEEPAGEPPHGSVRAPAELPPEDEDEDEDDAEVEPPARTDGEAEKPEGDDVLEETPEFLQETPEHDRLWFEQKPPRDFDFGS